MSEHEYKDILSNHGVPLDGLFEVALDRNWALQAVEALRHAGTPILGGDLYMIQDGRPITAHAGWDCDRRPEEVDREYAGRSAQQAHQYISNTRPGDTNCLFVLVPDPQVEDAS